MKMDMERPITPMDLQLKIEMARRICSERKDGTFFVMLLSSAVHRLLDKANALEKEMLGLPEMPEETKDKILVTVGQSRLLAQDKLGKQFKNLCELHLGLKTSEGAPCVTCEDLGGFWDLIKIELNAVDAMYVDIDKVRSNGWKELPQPLSVPTTPHRSSKLQLKTIPAVMSSRGVEAARQRDLVRNMLRQERRLAAQQLKKEEQQKEIDIKNFKI